MDWPCPRQGFHPKSRKDGNVVLNRELREIGEVFTFYLSLFFGFPAGIGVSRPRLTPARKGPMLGVEGTGQPLRGDAERKVRTPQGGEPANGRAG